MAGLVGADEVAEMLGVPRWKVYELASNEVIPSVRLGTRTVKFDPSKISDFVEHGGLGQRGARAQAVAR